MNCTQPTMNRYFLLLLAFLAFVFTSCKEKRYSSNDMTRLDSAYVSALHYDSIPYNKSHLWVPEAIKFVDTVFYRLKNPSIAEQLFRYDRLVTFNFKSRNYSSAIAICDSMIELIEKANAIATFPSEYALAHFWSGDSYSYMGDYMKAYQCYFKGRKLTQPYIDICAQGEYTYRIGMSLFREGQYNESCRYFKNCIVPTENCSKHVKYFYRRQELLNNIGLCFEKLKQPDSALYYYTKALAKIESIVVLFPKEFNADVARGVVYGNMGKVYLDKGDTAGAINYLQKNIAINLKPYHDSHDAFFSMLKLSNIYTEQKRLPEAYQLIEQVKLGIDTLFYQDTKELLLLSQARYFEVAGNTTLTNTFLKEYVALRDSAEKQKRLSKEMDVQQYLTTLEQEEENRILKEDNRSKQLLVVYSLAIGLFLLMLLLGGMFLYKKSRGYVRKLTQLNQTVEQQKTELEQRNKDKDQIMRIVAHDLRNPIWGINALSKIMLDDMPASDKQHEGIQLIHSSSDATINLINELLEATMGLDEDMKKQPHNLCKVISNAVDLLHLKATEKQLRLVWKEEQYSPLVFAFNKDKIARVLNNLIFNAIKFSYAGADIVISVKVEKDSAIVAVKDRGMGIPVHLQGKIFDTFTPAKRSGTAGEQSFGLGLSICRTIAHAHGGKLWLESKENEGSVFYLELPMNN